jgi:hypothetical protein
MELLREPLGDIAMNPGCVAPTYGGVRVVPDGVILHLTQQRGEFAIQRAYNRRKPLTLHQLLMRLKRPLQKQVAQTKQRRHQREHHAQQQPQKAHADGQARPPLAQPPHSHPRPQPPSPKLPRAHMRVMPYRSARPTRV